MTEVPRSQAKSYLAKAEQFLIDASAASQGRRYDSAMLNAVRAAISACDAATTALLGQRSVDPNHQRAADLLQETLRDSNVEPAPVRQLRALLAKKNIVEYEARRATAKEATDAVARAERLVRWARDLVSKARV